MEKEVWRFGHDVAVRSGLHIIYFKCTYLAEQYYVPLW